MRNNNIREKHKKYLDIKEKQELLLCLILFFFFPVLEMPYLLYKIGTENNKLRSNIYIFFFCGAMGILAYYTVPLASDDLSRHYANMDVLRYTEFKDIFRASYPLVYLNTIIMTLFSKLGVYQLYPMLYIIVGYGLILITFTKVTAKTKLFLTERISILLFVLCAVNCRDFISGLRNYFSFIICMFLVVSSKVFKYKKVYTYIGIICATFIHTSAIAFLIWEIISDLPKNKALKRILIFLIFLTLPMLYMISTGGIPGIPHTIVDKLNMYLTTSHIVNLNVYLYQIGIVVLMIGCHLINRKINISKFKEINNFFDYYLIFMIAIIPIMTFLSRFVTFLVAISPVIFIQTYCILRNNKKMRWLLSVILLCFILAGIVMLVASIKAYPWNFSVKNIFVWWL